MSEQAPRKPHKISAVLLFDRTRGTRSRAGAIYLKALRSLHKTGFAPEKWAIGYLCKNLAAFKKTDIESAGKSMLEALKLDPHYLPARLKLAECYQALGNYKQAIVEYTRTLEQINSKKRLSSGERKLIAVIYREIGKCHIALNAVDAAIDAYKQASDYVLTNPEDYYQLAQCYKAKKDFASALICCFKAICFYKSLQQLEYYNKEFEALKKLAAAATNLMRTRSFVMYEELEKANGFNIDFAQSIANDGLVVVDHWVNLVVAQERGLKVLSLGAGPREGVLVDYSSAEFAKQMATVLGLQQLFKNLAPSDSLANLAVIADHIHAAVPYKDFTADEMKQNQNQILELYKFNKQTSAVCRHIAQHVAYVLTLVMQKGLLPSGSVYVFRNSVEHKGHALCIYMPRNREQFFLIDAGLSDKSGKRVNDLNNSDDRRDIVLGYKKIDMPGLLDNLLNEYNIPIPSEEQLANRAKEQEAAAKLQEQKAKDEAMAQDEVPTQPFENELSQPAEQDSALKH